MKVKYGLIGSGWRAEFYLRIARLVPDQFEVTAVMVREQAKGEAVAARFGVPVVSDLDGLLATKPDFVVACVKRGFLAGYVTELSRRGVPALCETPPAETEAELLNLWEDVNRFSGRVQVAEQYFAQPLYAAYETALRGGLIGRVENISLSALHGYHGASIIRRYLNAGFGNAAIYGKRYRYEVTETYGREGMCFDGETFVCPRDRLTFEFDNGTTAFFDFSDPAQYHSFIRTRQLNVQGVRGEIDDLTVRYLTEQNVPVTQELKRIDLGVYGNQEWCHFGIMLGERFLYRSPFGNARLNDDEIAVATCLQGMRRYLETGEDCYSLRDALQDMYLCLTMERALSEPLTVIRTRTMPWVP
ncbi:MAG TPA: Gfo/Idh/MocA family oxidoreductase [Candidatus Limiplasma sp.]|nr:Gfo/Idh/MocA family oxidoreductase [Candidatus Limiplasma sp.]HPS80423.1 Gfo/Idh/MocA family oxidoreductase [Candidatus Limiplasma sp.]